MTFRRVFVFTFPVSCRSDGTIHVSFTSHETYTMAVVRQTIAPPSATSSSPPRLLSSSFRWVTDSSINMGSVSTGTSVQTSGLPPVSSSTDGVTPVSFRLNVTFGELTTSRV